MIEKDLIKKQQKRGHGVRFVRDVLTPQNPKDMFYQNIEQQVTAYMVMILVGLMMVMYLVIY